MSVFQSTEFFNVLLKTYDTIPFKVESLKSNYNSYIQGYITNDNNSIKNFFTKRAIIYGNSILPDNKIEELDYLLREVKTKLSGKAIYIEFRNLTDQSYFKQIYEKNGFIYEDHLNILVDLTKSEEILWKEVNSKRRNEIRRATKEAVVFHVKNDMKSLMECYSIIKEVYLRAKLPLYKFDFFKNLFVYLQGDAKLHIFTAVFEERIIGCMLALGYEGVLYDFYAGSKSKYYKKHPNDLIPWEVFLWGKKNGYHTFDFGGAGKPSIPYKVRDYKKQFGGKLVNYGRFKCILNKPLYKIGEVGVKLMKRL